MSKRDSIIEYLKTVLSGYRLEHTLSVEEECLALCDIFGINGERKEKLSYGALLHDITKPLTLEEHIEICKKHGEYALIDEIKLAPKTAHAFTGALEAAERFPDSVDKTIENAIRYHTTGREDMTLEEKIIYLADFIEPKRTFESCRMLRKYFYDSISTDNNINNKIYILDKTLLLSFDITIKELIDEGAYISPYTSSARNFIINTLSD